MIVVEKILDGKDGATVVRQGVAPLAWLYQMEITLNKKKLSQIANAMEDLAKKKAWEKPPQNVSSGEKKTLWGKVSELVGVTVANCAEVAKQEEDETITKALLGFAIGAVYGFFIQTCCDLPQVKGLELETMKEQYKEFLTHTQTGASTTEFKSTMEKIIEKSLANFDNIVKKIFSDGACLPSSKPSALSPENIGFGTGIAYVLLQITCPNDIHTPTGRSQQNQSETVVDDVEVSSVEDEDDDNVPPQPKQVSKKRDHPHEETSGRKSDPKSSANSKPKAKVESAASKAVPNSAVPNSKSSVENVSKGREPMEKPPISMPQVNGLEERRRRMASVPLNELVPKMLDRCLDTSLESRSDEPVGGGFLQHFGHAQDIYPRDRMGQVVILDEPAIIPEDENYIPKSMTWWGVKACSLKRLPTNDSSDDESPAKS